MSEFLTVRVLIFAFCSASWVAILWSAQNALAFHLCIFQTQQKQDLDGILPQGHNAFRRFGERFFIPAVFYRERVRGSQSCTH